ncbi:MlaD family protein [Cyclobacterium qasimii]|uniref:ABC transporter, permease component n=2 Tax=Cyclobacterium qasimii TaxID=1350429 RepID=S7WEW2_9BACT|nr:MlaD family protein [Cyclobacterium qasimii]EPR65294.1 ABC transporter, permease component [Cyclobacterium qasimii M12-11B]GEO21905.1 mammalian cell entry protein [Cyclobacterium qasimii]
MGKSNSYKAKVGLFVVIGTVLLIAILYFVGMRQHIFSSNIQLYSIFENVNGLQTGNNVRYSGIDVGTVSKIEMIDERNIRIQLMVEDKISRFIKKDAITFIGSDGLVGSMVVNIVPGNEQNTTSVSSGDTIQSYSKVGTDDMLSTLSTTNENAALLTEDLLKITQKILQGKGTLGTLLSDTLLARDIRQSLIALKNATQSTSTLVTRVNAIIEQVNYNESTAAVLLSDTISASQMKAVFFNLEKSSKGINSVTQNLEEYLTEIKSGKGTFNHFTQDEALSKNIDSTMVNIKEAAEKLNANMEALKHNFLFRRYFKKQERQQKREAD